MEPTGAKSVDPKGSQDSKAKKAESPPSQAFDKLKVRAETKTDLLVEILAREQSLDLRHWGLNE